MTHVAHLAIRNRGTIGGSLSHADPAAELPMMALLLDAEASHRFGSRHADASPRATFSSTRMTVDLAGTRHRHRDRAAEIAAADRLGF